MITVSKKTFTAWLVTALDAAAIIYASVMSYWMKTAVFLPCIAVLAIGLVFAICFVVGRMRMDMEQGVDAIDSKETMVAAVAHEIKNPLNSIKGANQYLHDKYKNENDIREFTAIVIDEINRLEKYLNEFMSFSRGVRPNLKKQNINNFLTGILMLVKHSFPYGIRVVAESEKIPDIYMDAEQMRQVLVNLINNAKDATHGRPNPRVEVRLGADDKHVYIRVKDNGAGIEKKEIHKIFTPFFTTKKEGLGIGLAICKSIVKKHNGELSVESEKDKGSVFTISLPVEKRGKGR
jgi:signal transduction histidine kinase